MWGKMFVMKFSISTAVLNDLPNLKSCVASVHQHSNSIDSKHSIWVADQREPLKLSEEGVIVHE